MGDGRDRDQLLQALAELANFYAAHTRMRAEKTHRLGPRQSVLLWLRALDPLERAAVCTTVDVAFVRLLIEIAAAAKSKLKARVDQFLVLREHGPAKAKDRATFTRRPVLRTRDGDDLSLPYSAPYDAAALHLVDNMRIFNSAKSCDTISPSVAVVRDIDTFVATMDMLTMGNFLRAEPTEAMLKSSPWSEQKWLTSLGYYSLATYLAHQFELNIWRRFKTRAVPSVGFLAKRHLCAQWLATPLDQQTSVLHTVRNETCGFLRGFASTSWPSARLALSLVVEVMQPPVTAPQSAEDLWSCSLVHAGKRPHMALIKMLWAEHLQTASTALLEAVLVQPPASGPTPVVLTAKQRKRKEHRRQAKEKKREREAHTELLGGVLAELKRHCKQAQRIKVGVKQVLDELVDAVVVATSAPLKPKRHKKKKVRPSALPGLHNSDDRIPGFLLLHLDHPPVTPPRRRRVSVDTTFDPLLDIAAFLTPQKPAMRYQHYFIEDDSPSADFDAFATQFALPSPKTATDAFFFPSAATTATAAPATDADADDPSPACEWYLPSSVLSQSSGSRGEEWSAFTWRADDDSSGNGFYAKDRAVWLADKPSPRRCRCHDADVPSEEVKAQSTLLEALQRQCNDYAQNVTSLEAEMASLKGTVAELQAALFAVQKELQQWKQEAAALPVAAEPPTPAPTPFVSVPHSLLPPRSKLHWDICEFVSQLQAETQQRMAAHTAVSRFCVSAVQALWPRAQVRPYGSFVTGLSLPSSDLDLVICLPKVRRDEPAEAPGVLEGRNAIKETWQQHLARKLRSEPWVLPESVKTIPNASIPIITLLTTAPYHVRLDISFEGPGHNGLATNDLVLSLVHELPALTPLMLVLKTFVIERGLGVAYTGGLSSYALLLLVTRFLQEFHGGGFDASVATQCNLAVAAQSRADFGAMLLGFMDFFGTKFDPRATGISVATRSFLSRDHPHCGPPSTSGWHPVQMEHVQFENMNLSSPGSRRQHLHRDSWSHLPPFDYDPHKFDPVYIEDPLRPANNVGRNCFRIMQIRRALATAWATLTEPRVLPPAPYVGGVRLHPGNLLRGILSCTHEPKWKGPVEEPVAATPVLASPVRHPPRERTVTSASKSKEKHKPKRRHSACVNDLLTKPVLDDGAIAYSSLSPSRSLSFADVVIGKSAASDGADTPQQSLEP
ncbi:hypothetical protein ACHHYP_17382 [Achlya hypogyna]|uniref:Poly(A) RNA polymerase mitochondrial-like central palm domain-containing protein n=1 Tax=Achlya hypogyna TaxID=1202772 RepID=A0A1V9ZDK5_ACHHY|nr:hypothetical protein ACHHYP_17382 [Achlya hypogyna]